jgi:hypothetical protein
MARLRDFRDPNKYQGLLGHFSADNWRQKRAENLIGARNCREALINPDGPWGYSPDDERVKAGVRVWVARAKRCHEMALGRKPVMENFTFISREGGFSGQVFASESGAVNAPERGVA